MAAATAAGSVGAEPAGGDNSARHLPLGRPRRPANAVGRREPSDAERLVPDPPPTTPAPVIAWLHTGAFVVTSANFSGSNGRKAEPTGAIVVSPNYRLGPFGFLVHTAPSRPRIRAVQPATTAFWINAPRSAGCATTSRGSEETPAT